MSKLLIAASVMLIPAAIATMSADQAMTSVQADLAKSSTEERLVTCGGRMNAANECLDVNGNITRPADAPIP